jgi:GT2 family glycosyltransferase
MADPQVTIVVVPRERFSFTRESLESIYEHTEFPFKLVYVDGNSPPSIRRYLEAQAREKGFQLIRTDYYLSPNHARNLGLSQVNSKYVVFIDNDVLVTTGWLAHLVQCAEETGASVISPLICIGKPEQEIIHSAGGEAHIRLDTKNGKVERRFREVMHGCNQPIANMRDHLQRQQTELAEFHCMFVRTEIFKQVGAFDERMLNTREHLDFCMLVTQAESTIYLEPTSIVTYVPGPPLEWTDIPFYMLRWSDAWAVASVQYFRDKWDLTGNETSKKGSSVSFRRKATLIKPLVRSLLFGRRSLLLEKVLVHLDMQLNRYLTNRYARKQAQRLQEAPTQPPLPVATPTSVYT